MAAYSARKWALRVEEHWVEPRDAARVATMVESLGVNLDGKLVVHLVERLVVRKDTRSAVRMEVNSDGLRVDLMVNR